MEGALRVGCINIVGLRSKINNKDLFDLLKTNYVSGLVESWDRFDRPSYDVKGYSSYIKGRNKDCSIHED